MTLRQTLEIYDLLDSPRVGGADVRDFLITRGAAPDEVTVTRVEGPAGRLDARSGQVDALSGRPDGAATGTDFVKLVVPGLDGAAPTLGVIGRLGAMGARPHVVGLVSDADGAVAALATALKLLDMRRAGDRLPGKVIVATHVCPNGPTEPHDPVPFMGSPVDMGTMNAHEVDPEMDAVLSIDATKGNRVINWRGIAISPTVKEGWILRVSEDLLKILEATTGEPPRVLPITTQDITPYDNGVFHLNSILQPATATAAPVVGVAVTAVVPTPGCATGACRELDCAAAARFAVEVAKGFTAGRVRFYDQDEFARLKRLYGEMSRLQGTGRRLGGTGQVPE